jgi:hypothetical protein
MSKIPPNERRSADKITRSLKALTVPASKSRTFRTMAANALRTGRKTAPGNSRDAHFCLAASYKSLAHDDEWTCGERQRSHKHKNQAKKSESG